ncbi:MAG TPA: rhodanese-like domain-containing protein [Caulifigura sp.]|jgi:predicted sulfurtransferase|nr:rhodanese-like domain-containing protein [Caulifigura sp.]
MSQVLNVAAYKFVELSGLETLRAVLKAACEAVGVKGTILLAPEGINLFLAGTRAAIDEALERIRQVPGLDDLTAKESFSDAQPFRKLLVKIKPEIIAFGRQEVAPATRTSPRISPQELKRWLDEGRDVTLLDTRNSYEVAVGTFAGAVTPPLEDFRHFPDAVAQLPGELKHRPVVTFCTGGIRCEKAAPWLELAGFENVLQLDGGILKYFEECGGAHFEGNCFVFDERAAVTPELAPVSDPRVVRGLEPASK